jgi:hypothetical protein
MSKKKKKKSIITTSTYPKIVIRDTNHIPHVLKQHFSPLLQIQLYLMLFLPILSFIFSFSLRKDEKMNKFGASSSKQERKRERSRYNLKVII